MNFFGDLPRQPFVITVVDGGISPLGGGGREVDTDRWTGRIGVVSMLTNTDTAIGNQTQVRC